MDIDVETEVGKFIRIWLIVLASLTYCHFISKIIPKGFKRLFSLLPVISIFLYLPHTLSSVHFIFIVGFTVSWVVNFKLLLFAFNHGPLSNTSTENPLSYYSLKQFVSAACLPIKIKQKSRSAEEPTIHDQTISRRNPKSIVRLLNNYPMKVLAMCLLIHVYSYKQYIHPLFLGSLYALHMFFISETYLVVSSAIAALILRLDDLEPQFIDPFISTSLQDFWGRRWNLMATNILWLTVYVPIRSVCAHVIGRKWATVPAILFTFLVSGLMHELIIYYITRLYPTWEVTCFFVIQGICIAFGGIMKKTNIGGIHDRFQLHPWISGPLILLFIGVNVICFFFPPILRNNIDDRTIEEYHILVDYFVKKFARKQT
ncbi:probable long-chain-alcohol O-fatty-acyltransferase 1 [Papaver somniferum]|uniref:probable long-chain-alcohol O-fatty-acyltransferase 1 n=1 Tax=Papaver somniferum TaxID=3469 RepID=UPI000E70533C|nr:probable long-chain-alcohol O-fatty-acyltransferase 1 [Papaver somniferum]